MWSVNNIFLYLLAAGFVVLVWLMLSGTKIDWSMFDPRPRSWQVASEAYKYWPVSARGLTLKEPGSVDEKVDASTLPPPYLDSKYYTVSFEFILYNTRNNVTGSTQLRHILSRGAPPAAGVSGPPIANPGVYLDSLTNDILVFVQTGPSTSVSVRIEDIPMDIPQRMTIVVRDRVLEVYLNCQLEITEVMSAPPFKDISKEWYGVSGTNAANAAVQNLYIWPRDLKSIEVRTLCSSPITPFSPSCGQITLDSVVTNTNAAINSLMTQ
jgi:hypothetical protein